jgi:1-phosphatidylinositol-3-phosphate 5-kinase
LTWKVLHVQEQEYLKNAVAKIVAQRPHVLLVEKSIPMYAQELLAKDISLVLNVKRSLLERISRCTGGQIASSIDNVTSARLGHCQAFWIERVSETLAPKDLHRKSVKTLMFFDGCPRRLGCTVMHKTVHCLPKIINIPCHEKLSVNSHHVVCF